MRSDTRVASWLLRCLTVSHMELGDETSLTLSVDGVQNAVSMH